MTRQAPWSCGFRLLRLIGDRRDGSPLRQGASRWAAALARTHARGSHERRPGHQVRRRRRHLQPRIRAWRETRCCRRDHLQRRARRPAAVGKHSCDGAGTPPPRWRARGWGPDGGVRRHSGLRARPRMRARWRTGNRRYPPPRSPLLGGDPVGRVCALRGIGGGPAAATGSLRARRLGVGGARRGRTRRRSLSAA